MRESVFFKSALQLAKYAVSEKKSEKCAGNEMPSIAEAYSEFNEKKVL